jgi:hypothetical protein
MTATKSGSRSIDRASRRVAVHFAGSQFVFDDQRHDASGNYLATSHDQLDNEGAVARSNHLPDGHASCVCHLPPAVGLNLRAGQRSDVNQWKIACVNHLATSQGLHDNQATNARSNHFAASQTDYDDHGEIACGNTFDNQIKGQQ